MFKRVFLGASIVLTLCSCGSPRVNYADPSVLQKLQDSPNAGNAIPIFTIPPRFPKRLLLKE